MPVLEKVKLPAEYLLLEKEQKEMGDKNGCAVLAVAALVGKSYKETYKQFELHGRKHRKSTPKTVTKRVCDDYNLKLNMIGNYELYAQDGLAHKLIKMYPTANKPRSLTTYQVQKFPVVWSRLPNALLFTNAHVSAFVDGVVCDWAIGNKAHIRKIWFVENVT